MQEAQGHIECLTLKAGATGQDQQIWPIAVLKESDEAWHGYYLDRRSMTEGESCPFSKSLWTSVRTVDPMGPLALDDLLFLKRHMRQHLKVCHCGSTDKAAAAFEEWRLKDTLEGKIVLTIGANAKDQDLAIGPIKKVELDILHLAKIEDADLVRILNPGGYIGESTRRELDFARRLKKPIWFLEPPAHES